MDRIITGDALMVLRTLPENFIQTCITSPPYYGLRDYGTAEWNGGNPECDHFKGLLASEKSTLRNDGREHTGPYEGEKKRTTGIPYKDTCGKCGAVRIDQQIGLEASPDEYVTRLVEVFREVRRVLSEDGTLWLNLGDTYANDTKWGGSTGGKHVEELHGDNATRHRRYTGLKPKDLIGIPWMVAFALRADGWYLRSDIIWNKPNAMPESVEDRPTKSHEYLFLLSKNERYYYDSDAIRECFSADTYRNLGGIPARGKSPSSNAYPGQSQKLGGWSVGNPEQGRNKRSVWTIPSQPFSGALLLADYVGTDGRAYKVSQDCPFHGRTRGTHIQKTGGYDVQQDHASDRKSDTSNYRGQEQSSESDSIPSHEFQDLMNGNVHKQNLENTLDYRNVDGFDSDILQIDRGTAHTQEIPAYSSDSQYPLCSETAIDHSTQNNKTGHVPETNPAYTPSVESPSRIDDMSDLPLWSGQHDCNDESNIKQDGLGGHPLERTGYRNSGKSSVQNTFSAYVHGNTAKCTCQAVSIDHFATFPPKLIEPCILAGSRPGNIVLDPFIGAGTTALVAIRHGRQYLGVELNPEYVTLAEKRIQHVQQNLWTVEGIA